MFCHSCVCLCIFFFKQKTAYEMRISDWSSDVCSSDLLANFETYDVGKHWRTRRSGAWGYMHDLQSRVANRIFPKVQQILSEMTEQFARFIGDRKSVV